MSETPNHETEPTTAPVTTVPPTTVPPTATYADRPAYVEPAPRRKSQRLYQVAAWVGIAAGSVFIVAVIFFTGFALGAHSGGGYGGGRHGQEMGMHRGDGPPMMPMRPSFIFPGGPGGPGGFGPGGPGQGEFGPGPGNAGPGQAPQAPTPQRPS